MFKIELNKENNKLNIYNFSEQIKLIKTSNKSNNLKTKIYDSILIELGLNVLTPTTDENDFILTFTSTNIIKNTYKKSLLGNKILNIFSSNKNILNLLKEILKNGNTKTMSINFYEKNNLKLSLDIKITKNNKTNELFLFVKDMTRLSYLENIYSSEIRPPTITIQNNAIVKTNKTFKEAYIKNNEMLITADMIMNGEIFYNNMGVVLNIKQIEEKLIKREQMYIHFHLKINEEKILEMHGALTEYDNKPAIKYTIISELEKDIVHKTNLNLIQEYTKSTFVISYLDENKYEWSRELESILEEKIPIDCDLEELAKKMVIPSDLKKINKNHNKELIINNKKMHLKIKTSTGKIKYLEIIPKFYNNSENKILFIIIDKTEEYLNDNEKYALLNAVENIQKGTSIGINYKDKDGKYHWTKEHYKIIERDPRDDDIYKHIILDLIPDEKEAEYIKNKLEKLKINTFLEDKVINIRLESGKEKYLRINACKIYDPYTQFIKHTEYIEDITKNHKKSNELLEIQDMVKSIEKMANISIHQRDKNGIYTWTDETYKIIERTPRPKDKNNHIIRELVIEEDLKKVEEELNENKEKIKPIIFRIKTENGKIKYLEGFTEKYYDNKGKIYKIHEYVQDITEKIKKTRELKRMNNIVQDVQKAGNISIHYKNNKGEYIWTPETYNIIERKPRNSDKENHIIFNLIESNEEKKILEDLISNLEPNKFLGKQIIKIKTEKETEKYLKIDVKKNYDKKGNFIQQNGYAQDITEEMLNNRELTRLTKTLKDVQRAKSIAISYKSAKNEYLWTEEIYNIIEREKDKSDKYYNIILDLTESKYRKKIRNKINNLKPNEFLGKTIIPITLDSGKLKMIEIDCYKIYDKNGEYKQTSNYVHDITKQYYLEKETTLLNEINKNVLNSLKIGLYIIDPNENYVRLTEGYYKITKLPKTNDLNKAINDFTTHVIGDKDKLKEMFDFENITKIGKFEHGFNYKLPNSEKIISLYTYCMPYTYENKTLYIGATQKIVRSEK